MDEAKQDIDFSFSCGDSAEVQVPLSTNFYLSNRRRQVCSQSLLAESEVTNEEMENLVCVDLMVEGIGIFDMVSQDEELPGERFMKAVPILWTRN